MTNSLTTTRAHVATVLNTAGITALDNVPERVAPPVVVVEPGSPYLEEGNTFTNNLVRLSLRVIERPGTNEVQMDNLDQTISTIVTALKADDQYTVSVSGPFALIIGSAEYPAVDITVEIYITL